MTDPTPRRVTSADVARIAGVSRATVSYVLNNTPHQTISAGTRARVLDAAAGLGYAPSAAARTLRTGRSDVVLCLLPDWPIGQEVGALLGNLSAELDRAGLTLLAHPGTRAGRPVTQLWRGITPAAVLAFSGFSGTEARAMRAAGVALVEAPLGRPGPETPEGAQHRVGALQADHLAASGHTRIGYAYPDDDRVRVFAEPRLDGVRARCAALHLPPPLVRTVPLEPDPAAEAVRTWHGSGVTAVCAYNDEVALAVLAGLRPAGLTAPADLAVIGVDDLPAGRLADPALTTVTTDQATVAAHLVTAVLAAVHGETSPALDLTSAIRVLARASA
ncbi:LacI family DNA-binding transcriptional regulator [Pseudosporangium ferrugineum]|uniref:LacI family transcriptional regulator n=1 Tax=Pseudosporangium ferrugineum TaxID=439699 RepID=A0A2T0SJ13_9ACTN|nr:LacI family DNA-binding transcriptional regulator [Pseudosporangium ferrugineum]PRY33394.1 LacI family transcriptional regulator [Pseudosporangium ferrugineum]